MGKAASAHSSNSGTSLKTIAIVLIIVAAIGATASFLLLQKSQKTSSEASELACLNDTGTVTCTFEVTANTAVEYGMTITYVEEDDFGTQQTRTITLQQNQLTITQNSPTQSVIKGSAQVPLKSTYSCDITVTPLEYPECGSSASQTTVCTYSNTPTSPPPATSTPIPDNQVTLIPSDPEITPTAVPTVIPGEPTYTPTPEVTESEPSTTPTSVPTVIPGEPTYTPTPAPTDTVIADGNGNPAVTATTAPTSALTSAQSTNAATATPVQSLPETGTIAQLSFVILLSGFIIIVLGFVI